MAKNQDDYKEDEDTPIKPIVRCRIIPDDAPGLLIVLAEYFDRVKDERADKTLAINLAVRVGVAEMLRVAMIDSAKMQRNEAEVAEPIQ